MVSDAPDNETQVDFRIEVVEFGRTDQAVNCGGAFATRIRTGKQEVFSPQSIMGFRQFQLRGLANVTNEWALVCLAWNLKRMVALRLQ